MSDLKKISADLRALANQARAQVSQRFFKTGPGEYGQGDRFLGLTVPQQRVLASKYRYLSLTDIKVLLRSPFHEFRLVGLLILIEKYQGAPSSREAEKIVNFYLKNSSAINNWDLVDLSVYKILGDFLSRRPDKIKILDKLSKSANLWERRLAIIATFAFIKKGEIKETFRLAEKLINDKEDLIHKAVGWMLREAGKRVSQKELKKFLDKWAKTMPRTALRYALEKLSPAEREYYLKKRI